MRINKPKFWDQKISLFSLILLPFTILVKLIILLRKRLVKGEKFNIPVICIGNIYVGGTGKTPLAAEIYKFIKSSGFAKYVKIKIPIKAKIICVKILVLDEIPAELFPLIFFMSSYAPNIPKEATIKIKNQLNGLFKSDHNNIPENNPIKISTPPIVGVPIFFIM